MPESSIPYGENDLLPYMPIPPDLDKINMTIVEWIEEVVTQQPAKGYMSSERDRGDTINSAEDEEDEHWTAIARSLNTQQIRSLEERIWQLQHITGVLNQFRLKTDSNYLTKKETRAYIKRRAKEGFNSWHAKREIRDGKLVPPLD